MIKNTLLKSLEKYFAENTREKIESDWESTKKYDKVGPTIHDFLNESEKIRKSQSILRTIDINIWDDFGDGKTYAYIENDNISYDDEEKYLTILFDLIKDNSILSNVEMEIKFHDTKDDYDAEIVKRCIEEYGESFYFKRWELVFSNITSENIYELVDDLNNNELIFNNLKFNIYSES